MALQENALIERWAEGISLAICRRCRGWGVVGLITLQATCPQCGGSGRIVEVPDAVVSTS